MSYLVHHFRVLKDYLFLLMLLTQVLQIMKQVLIERLKRVLNNGRNFYDQPISDLMKQYDEVRKVSTGHGEDYTTGYLLDYASFNDNYRLVVVD